MKPAFVPSRSVTSPPLDSRCNHIGDRNHGSFASLTGTREIVRLLFFFIGFAAAAAAPLPLAVEAAAGRLAPLRFFELDARGAFCGPKGGDTASKDGGLRIRFQKTLSFFF